MTEEDPQASPARERRASISLASFRGDRRDTDLAESHTPEAIRERLAGRRSVHSVGDYVLGAVDGTITTFAIVAGAAGADLAIGAALVLGVANAVADGFSMAVSNYLKSQADVQMVERLRQTEHHHIETVPEGEREEIRQIFASKGFSGAILEEIVEILTNDRQRWIDTMLVEEWGVSLDPPSPLRAAVATFAAFVVAGMFPILPLGIVLVAFGGAVEMPTVFAASAIVTGATFFLIGWARGRLSDQSPWRAAVETLAIGGIAATLAYGIGLALRNAALS